MFDQKGSIKIENSDMDDEELMLIAIEAGAEDVINEDDYVEIITGREDLFDVSEALEDQGIEIESANLIRIPATEVKADPDTARTNLKMMDSFDENDDVSNIFTNMKMDDETLELAESDS